MDQLVARSSQPSARAVGFVVVAVTFAVFAQCIFFDFVGWDDALFISSNPRFNPPTWQTIWYYWTHAGFNLYMPVSYSFWAVIAKLAEMPAPDAAGNRLNPFVFHLAGLVCHLIATAAVYGILLIAVRSVSGAGLGAIAFGIHPLMTEPVAFIGTMNTPIAAALALPAVWLYLSDDLSNQYRKRWRWMLATFLYGLSLLAKPTTVVIPLLAIGLEIAVLHRPIRRVMAGILPWVIITIPCVVWTRMIQSTNDVKTVAWWRHLWIAGDAVFFYLTKIVWPVRLGVDYGRTPAWVLVHPATAVACLLPVGIVVLAWVFRRRWSVFATAAVLYLVLLLPNSGLVSFDFQRVSNVADRYAYLPLFAVALALAEGFSKLRTRTAQRVGYGLVICVLGSWAMLTTLQLRTWRNGVTLFNHAVEVNPGSSYSFQCLAQADLAADAAADALAAANRSIELNPVNTQFRSVSSAKDFAAVIPPQGYASAWAEAAKAHISKANALDRLGRLNEAADELTIAMQMNPGNVIAATDLAFVLGRSGHQAQAAMWLHRAIEIDPAFIPARTALQRMAPGNAK